MWASAKATRSLVGLMAWGACQRIPNHWPCQHQMILRQCTTQLGIWNGPRVPDVGRKWGLVWSIG
jgi:hypothetical protein